MKFYDRVKELEVLNGLWEQSFRNACFTVMVGRRRIGKTMLLLESVRGAKHLYLFVSRQSEPLLCARFQEEIQKQLGLQIYGTVTRFRDLFEQLLKYAKENHYTLIIDEFQEFVNINPSIFSEIQDLWDRYKNELTLHFIACGSIYSMMMRIFEDRKEPLFGRLTSKMVLRPFPVQVLKEILHDHHPAFPPEDLLALYMLTGGGPKYIELLMQAGATTKEKMLDVVLGLDSPFLSEGRDLLVNEFGKEYGTYFSILQLIAVGKNTQSEIDSIVGKNTGAYLSNLEKEYSLITRCRPMFAPANSRKVRWSIADHYLRFWFRFIYPNQMLIEMNRLDLLREIVEKHYEQYSGLVLEQYFREKITADERVTAIGGYWDNKGMNEIDLIALNDLDKTALIAEVKRNPKKIDMKLLAAKADTLKKELAGYTLTLKGFSLEDM